MIKDVAFDTATTTKPPILNEFEGDLFEQVWDEVETRAHSLAVEKGWHEKEVDDGTRIALMHSELSEALEALRSGYSPMSDKIEEFLLVEEELADVVIRIMDFSGLHQYDVSGAIVAKMLHNQGRPHRHGGKSF